MTIGFNVRDIGAAKIQQWVSDTARQIEQQLRTAGYQLSEAMMLIEGLIDGDDEATEMVKNKNLGAEPKDTSLNQEVKKEKQPPEKSEKKEKSKVYK